MQKEREIEIDVRDLAKYLFKRWTMIAMIMLIAMVCSFGVARFLVTPIYESQSMIYITAGNTGGSVVQNMLSSLQAGNALTADYKTLATSKPVLEQAAKDLGLDITYAEFREKVSTENPDNTRILIIKVTDPDPYAAKKIVDRLTEIEIEKIADVMGMTKPNVLQWGDIRKTPVSASPLKVSFTAGLIALLLTVCVLFAGFIQNDTFANADDIDRALELGTLAEVPVFDDNKKSEKKFISVRRTKNEQDK